MAPRLFALVIGIDEYLDPYTPRLDGAVSDADRVAEYLTSRLLIPRSRIKNLRRSEATRSAIKKELLGLAENPSIGRDDPILIYFAGHGNDLEAPPEWKDWDSRVQSLLPYDYAQPDGEGGTIQGLADRSLGTILKKVADAKGNNIVSTRCPCLVTSAERQLPDRNPRLLPFSFWYTRGSPCPQFKKRWKAHTCKFGRRPFLNGYSGVSCASSVPSSRPSVARPSCCVYLYGGGLREQWPWGLHDCAVGRTIQDRIHRKHHLWRIDPHACYSDIVSADLVLKRNHSF